MKSQLLFAVLLLFSTLLLGQDTLEVTTEERTFTPPQYVAVYDDVFRNKDEAKWLVKWDCMGLLQLGSLGVDYAYTQLEAEYKLLHNLSVNTAGRIGWGTGFDRNYQLAIEPRLYINRGKKEAALRTTNNLNGNYIGLSFVRSITALDNIRQDVKKWGLVANYGIQRRVFNYWFVGYQLGIGVGEGNIENHQILDTKTAYWLHNKFVLGLVLGGKKSKDVNTCNLFNCFEEERGLLKLDIRNIFKQINKDAFAFIINPEYERKLGASAFSLNMGLGYGYFKTGNFSQIISSKGYTIVPTLEPRFYYDLKKRIAKGKSVNNLSGNYVSILVNTSFSNANLVGLRTSNDSVLFDMHTYGTRFYIEPKWGMQRRLFKNGFMDLGIALFGFTQDNTQYERILKDGKVEKLNFSSIVLKSLNGFRLYRSELLNIPFPRLNFKIGLAF
jgi:hypothetical protein